MATMSFDEMVGSNGIPSFEEMAGGKPTESVPQGVPSFEEMVSDKQEIGFGEEFISDIPGKIPFSPTRMLETADLIGSSRRLVGEKYAEMPLFTSLNTSTALQQAKGQGAWVPTNVSGLPEWTGGLQKQHDIKVVEDYIIAQSEKAERGYSTMGRVGQITSEMPKFVVEFMMTGGLSKLGSEAAKKAGTKMLGKYAATTAGKVAIATGELATSSAFRAAGMPHRAVESVLKRQAPKGMKIDDDGNVTIEESGESMATSVWKGLADHYIEILSEQAGEGIGKVSTGAFARLPYMGKLMPKLQAKWMAMEKGRTAGAFAKKISTATGFHGTLSEVGEEFLATQLKAITDVDDFGAGEDATMWERVTAGFNQDVENLPAMMIAFAVPGVARYGAGKVIDAQIKKNQELQDEVNFVNDLDPTDYYEAGLAEHYRSGLKKGFKEPGTSKYITPKWQLNRLLGIETTLEDVVDSHESAQLEQKNIKGWVNTTIIKLKTEKDLARLPELLTAEAGKEAAWTGDKAELYSMGEEAPSQVFRNEDGKVVSETKDGGDSIEVFGKLQEGQLDSIQKKELTEYDYRLLQKEGADTATINNTDPVEAKKMVREVERKKSKGVDPTLIQKSTGQKLTLDTDLSAFAADVREGKAEPDPTETKAHVLQNKLDGNDNPIHIMRDLLDTYEYAPDFLSKSEADIFNALRTLTRSMRRRANESRRAQGLPEINDVKGYITHWMDRMADEIISGKHKTNDPTIKQMLINPTSKERTLEDLNGYFSKDLGRLLNIMAAHDLRDIYLTGPINAALEEVDTLVKKGIMPKSTAKELRDYINYDVLRKDTKIDQAFNVTASNASTLIRQLTKGRVVMDLNAAKILGPFRKLGFWSALGGRIKAPTRNLGQRMLLGDLYSTQAIAQAQVAQLANMMGKGPTMVDPITGDTVKLMDHIQDQKWYKLTTSKFEDTVDDTVDGATKTMLGNKVAAFTEKSLALYRASHMSNVHVVAMTGYYEWKNMYNASQDQNSEHYKRCVSEAIRRKVPVESLLTQESDMDWQMREAVRRTQWEYMTTSMPTMIRGQVSRAAFQFQSWWMNYYANHTRAMISQTLTGLNDKGRLLPKGGRARALKGMGTMYAIGKVVEDVAGIAVLKFLLFPYGDALSAPIPQFVGAFITFLFSKRASERKAAAKKLKQTMKFWVPYSLAMREIGGVLTGEVDLTEALFYQQKEVKY